MAVPTLAQICDAIKTTLGAAVDHSQAHDKLTEAITDLNMIQVYPEDGELSLGSGTDRKTFQGGARVWGNTIYADYYARQRGAGIGEEMGTLVAGIQAIMEVIAAQDTKNYFGLEGLQAFGPVSWRKVEFEYGNTSARYVGARFTIPVKVF